MDHAFFVSRLESIEQLRSDRHDFIHRHRTALDAFGQRFPGDEFHHQKPSAGGFFNAVNPCDVRMIQQRNGGNAAGC
jgi:hypothetical protein